MTSPVLEASGIVKSYRRRGEKPLDVLCGVSLSVARGERVAIVGRSGSGKTTLLNIMGGLDEPDAGNVSVDGIPLFGGIGAARRRQRARSGKIGFVFQAYRLMPDLDVAENVALPCLAGGCGMSRREARARAMELLEKVGLAGRASHLPSELSGGEQQRAALARALIRGPRLILADEPTGNLDSLTGAEIMDMLFAMSRDCSLAVVMVTHSPDAASRCDRVLRLESGRFAGS